MKVHSSIINKKVNYYTCAECGSIHQYPLPEQKALNEYYENYTKIKKKMNPGYLEGNGIETLFRERDKTFREIGFDINQIRDKMNVELGCANGMFLKYLERHDAKKIIGIDISKSLLGSIEIKNARLYAGDLSKIEENSIDILYLFNILEHIPDQKKLLELILTRLKVKSYLIVEVPLSGFVSCLFNDKWRFLMPDEHLHIPSKKALVSYFCQHGFSLHGFTRFGSGFTSGKINKFLKTMLDFSAKFFRVGDRGVFLFFLEKKTI